TQIDHEQAVGRGLEGRFEQGQRPLEGFGRDGARRGDTALTGAHDVSRTRERRAPRGSPRIGLGEGRGNSGGPSWGRYNTRSSVSGARFPPLTTHTTRLPGGRVTAPVISAARAAAP